MARLVAALLLAAAARGDRLGRLRRALGAPAGGSRLEGKDVVVSDLENVGNFQYILTVNVGGVELRSVVDTGSFSLITTSKQCPESRCPVRAFDPSESKGYEALDIRREAIFGSGSLKMRAAKSDLSFGPGFGPKHIRFWEMTDMGQRMTTLWESVEFDSILGMAWTKKVPERGGGWTNETTFLEYFGVQAFTICMGTDAYGMGGSAATPSRIYWGAPGAFTNDYVSRLAVVGDGHWAVRISNITVWRSDQKEPWKGGCWDRECSALIDSGTAVLTAPTQEYLQLTGLVGPVQDDCTNFDLLPTINFVLGEGASALEVTLKPATYIEHVKYTAFAGPNKGGVTERCTSMLINDNMHSSKMPVFVLGSPLMREYLWEFDRTSRPPSINVAKHPGHCPGGGGGGGGAAAPKSQAPGWEARMSPIAVPENAGARALLGARAPASRDAALAQPQRPADVADARKLIGVDGLGDFDFTL